MPRIPSGVDAFEWAKLSDSEKDKIRKEKQKERRQKWEKLNKERRLDISRKYRETHRDECRQSVRKYQKKIRDGYEVYISTIPLSSPLPSNTLEGVEGLRESEESN